MLEYARGLTASSLAAIDELERRVIAVDGGRLKLEWGTLRTRGDTQVQDVLWWEDGRLVGFAGLYSFGADVEVTGMVDPGARGRKVGATLLDAALGLCAERESAQVLLVVPRASAAGRRLALSRQGKFEHSEHAMELRTAPTSGPTDDRVSLRRAEPGDVSAVAELLASAFGDSAGSLAERLAQPESTTLVIERDRELVGSVRVDRRPDAGAGIYGFAIAPAWQGQGIGRQALQTVCQRLHANGVERIGLEVVAGNDRALGLYTSLGFAPVLVEDYFALPTALSGR